MSDYPDQSLFEFLREIEQNNNREWYMENRGRYRESVYEPLCGIIRLLHPTIDAIDSQIIDDPRKCISKIYNDMRFHPKAYMKQKVWIDWMRRNEKEKLGYFLEIDGYSIRYGMGFYQASAARMLNYRDKIDRQPSRFQSMIDIILKCGHLEILGENYKRLHESKLPERYLPFYNRKDIFVQFYSLDIQLLFDARFYDQMKADFLLLKDFYYFLLDLPILD